MRILIIENDQPLARFLHKRLETESYSVEVATDESQAAASIQQSQPDLAVLDLSIGLAAGIDLLKRIRAQNHFLPIMVLSPQAEAEERGRVLDLGADDCLTKPFAPLEFSARVRALLRRCTQAPPSSVIRVHDLEMDRVRRTVKRRGESIELTPKEFALLEYLMVNAGRRVTRAMIVNEVWKFSPDAMTNVVEVYINYLRNKLDKKFDLKLIHTVRGVGYQLG